MKNKLTFKEAKKHKFNIVDCVKYYFPKYTDEWCSHIIWEKTCYPMDTDTTFEQLYNLYLIRNPK